MGISGQSPKPHQPRLADARKFRSFSASTSQVRAMREDAHRRKSTPAAVPEEQTPPEPTLLQKAVAFRQKNKEKWEEREELREKSHRMMLGEYDWDPFLKRYVERFEKEKQEKLKQVQQQKRESRKILVSLEFNPSKERDPADEEDSSSSDDSDDEECVGHSQHVWGECEDGPQPELSLTAVTGKFLCNGLGEGEVQKCHVTVALYPDAEKREAELKSHSRFVTPLGTTKWNHKFAFSGLDAATLENKYFLFVLEAKTNRGKAVLGQAIIAGRKAVIKTRTRRRAPTEEEAKPLERALGSQNACVLAHLELQPEDQPNISFRTRLRNAVVNDVSQVKTFGRKMSTTTANLARKMSEAPVPPAHLRS